MKEISAVRSAPQALFGSKRPVLNPMCHDWGLLVACFSDPFVGVCSFAERLPRIGSDGLIERTEQSCVDIARSIERHRYLFVGIPPFALKVIARRCKLAKWDLSSVRLLATSASPWTPYERRRLVGCFPGLLAFADSYVTTEVRCVFLIGDYHW